MTERARSFTEHMRTRDGTVLVTDVHLPLDVSDPVPAVLLRTPYARPRFDVELPPVLAAGIAVVVQSVRGRHGSDGELRPYFNERTDGYDAVEWVAAQTWCDGNVGMMGASYGGWTTWAAALAHPPHLRTLISSVCCCQWTREWPWRNGVLWPGAITWLHMVAGSEDYELTAEERSRLDNSPTPLSRFQDRYLEYLPMADEWLAHPVDDEYWRPITITPKDFAGIDLPVLHITGWFDGCQIGSHFLYDGMRAHSPARAQQALLIGAWDHTVRDAKRSYDGIDFGPDSVIDYAEERVRWLQRWLRPGTSGEEPAGARVFATGSNRWLSLPTFPPDDTTEITLYLHEGALAEYPPTTQAALSFRYDPRNPVRTEVFPPLDRRAVLARDDVLVFSGPVLTEPVTLLGSACVELQVSSDAPDTDWFAELVDAVPDGARVLVALGMQRARFRGGDGREELTQPGERYMVTVQLAPRVHVFQPGHRIVLAVTSSGAPWWAPNPNNGEDIFTGTTVQVATNSVHVGGQSGSAVILPTSSPL